MLTNKELFNVTSEEELEKMQASNIINFEFSKFKNISEVSLALLEGCLQKDPNQRMSLSEIDKLIQLKSTSYLKELIENSSIISNIAKLSMNKELFIDKIGLKYSFSNKTQKINCEESYKGTSPIKVVSLSKKGFTYRMYRNERPNLTLNKSISIISIMPSQNQLQAELQASKAKINDHKNTIEKLTRQLQCMQTEAQTLHLKNQVSTIINLSMPSNSYTSDAVAIIREYGWLVNKMLNDLNELSKEISFNKKGVFIGKISNFITFEQSQQVFNTLLKELKQYILKCSTDDNSF